MKVAFINVNLKHGELEDCELTFYNHKCNIELGTLYLDSNTPWLPEDQVRHFNILKKTLQSEDWKKELIEFSPDLVALSALTYYSIELSSLAQWVKNNTQAIVIAGGPHVTAIEKEIMEEDAIDYAVSGEGEAAFQLFVEFCRGKEVDFSTIPGFIWREDAKIKCNLREGIPDLDALSYPSSKHINPREYSSFSSILNFKTLHMPIITTRGCPYKCVYCHDIMGKTIRYRSAASVVEEVDYWNKTANINTFFINDDIFNINRKRLKEIFGEFVKRKGLRFAFPNGLRADLLDKETVDLLVDGGTFYAMVAVESGDERVQSVIKKNLHLDKTFDIIEYMGNQNIVLGSFNIFGFPTETEEDIKRTIEFNESTSGLSKANFFVLNPHKGTMVYDMAIDQGFMPPQGSTQGYFNIHNSSPTKYVSTERLDELRKEAYRRFYLSEKRLDKILESDSTNMSPDDRRRFHRIDYSYVLRQFLEIESLNEIKQPDIHNRLKKLFPDGLVNSY